MIASMTSPVFGILKENAESLATPWYMRKEGGKGLQEKRKFWGRAAGERP
jgi:hypothetical protein